jgi:DNA invertase Pin-like site-specific DNA recombinase
MMGRDDLQKLLELASRKGFDVLVVEDFDRLARSMVDLPTIYKGLRFQGIQVLSANDGYADTLKIGLRSVFGELYVQDVANKVRRGMKGVLRDGRHAGGKAYGYDTVPDQPGCLEINEKEAEVVRRIFELYLKGRSPRSIAGQLNEERVPAPRGGKWNASTLNGNAQRGNGILFNELYAGRVIWNKVQMITNPDTGKRISRPNPREEWINIDAPHLRVVDESTWQSVQKLKSARSKIKSHEKRAPKHILSGKLKCGCCQSGMSVHDRDRTGKTRIRCSAVRESGSCTNRRIIYLPEIEEAVLGGLKGHLQNRAYLEIYVKQYNDEKRRLAIWATSNRDKLEEELRNIEQQYMRTKNLYVMGHLEQGEASHELGRLKQRGDEIKAELMNSCRGLDDVTLNDRAADRYLAQISTLADTLRKFGNDGETEVVESFRSLVHTVTVSPHGPRQGFDIEVTGRLALLLDRQPSTGIADSGLRSVAHLRYHQKKLTKVRAWRASC